MSQVKVLGRKFFTSEGYSVVGQLKPKIENRLLASIPGDDYHFLLPKLQMTELRLGQVLSEPHEEMEFAYFVTAGVCSIIAELEGVRSEVGLIGSEGFLGSNIVLYAQSAPFEAIVQMDGRALRISKPHLQEALTQRPAIHIPLLRYIHVFTVQTTQTALANAFYSPAARLARWLLMCHDRVGTQVFPMTQKFLTAMMAVKGDGVTPAISELESKKLIAATKDKIAILNRAGLEEIVGGAYGIPEREYERLMA
jgi:CRP-like cAMP-binding protein